MHVINLVEDKASCGEVSQTITHIANNSDDYFMDRLFGGIDEDNLNQFRTVKSWQPLCCLQDSCIYASEMVIILGKDGNYAVINRYDAGGSAIDHTGVNVLESKEQLKELFQTKFFAFNGLDDLTDQRISPRFSFDKIIDDLV